MERNPDNIEIFGLGHWNPHGEMSLNYFSDDNLNYLSTFLKKIRTKEMDMEESRWDYKEQNWLHFK